MGSVYAICIHINIQHRYINIIWKVGSSLLATLAFVSIFLCSFYNQITFQYTLHSIESHSVVPCVHSGVDTELIILFTSMNIAHTDKRIHLPYNDALVRQYPPYSWSVELFFSLPFCNGVCGFFWFLNIVC